MSKKRWRLENTIDSGIFKQNTITGNIIEGARQDIFIPIIIDVIDYHARSKTDVVNQGICIGGRWLLSKE